MIELDPKAKEALLTGLKQAKMKRMFFALVIKGGSDGVLIVSKLKISPKEIADAKKASGGSAIIKGACFGEKEKLIFEVAKLPAAGLAKVLKVIAHRDTALNIIPEFRLGDSPDLPDDDEADETQSESNAGQEETPVQHEVHQRPENAGDVAGDFSMRLKNLKSQIDQAIQGGGEKGQQIKLLASQVAMAARKQDFAEAGRFLDAIEKAMQGGQTTAEPGGSNGSPLAERMHKTEADLLKAVKANPDKRTALMNVWNFAQTKAAAGDAASAGKALDGLEKAIREILASAPKSDAERFGVRAGIVAERKAELEKYFASRVTAAQTRSAAQIESVEKAIAEQVPDEDSDELAGAIQEEVEDLYAQVRDALNNALNTEDGEQVLRAVESWRKQVSDNPLVQHLGTAKADLGAEADVLDDFETLFGEVSGKVRELVGA